MKHTRTTPAKLRAKGSTTLAAQLVEMRKSRDEFRSQVKFYRERLEQEANNLQYAEDKASEVMDLRWEYANLNRRFEVARRRLENALDDLRVAQEGNAKWFRAYIRSADANVKWCVFGVAGTLVGVGAWVYVATAL